MCERVAVDPDEMGAAVVVGAAAEHGGGVSRGPERRVDVGAVDRVAEQLDAPIEQHRDVGHGAHRSSPSAKTASASAS